MRGVATKNKHVEILGFKLFSKHFTFDSDEENFKKKSLKKYFDVSAVIDVVCGDTTEKSGKQG